MFKGGRSYPVAFASFLMQLFWVPIGEYFESFVLHWRIVPDRLLTSTLNQDFIIWYLTTYGLTWLVGVIPVTLIAIAHKHHPGWMLMVLPALGVFYYNIIQFPIQTYYEPFRIHDMLDQLYPHSAFWIIWLTIPSVIGYQLTEKQMLGAAALTLTGFLALSAYTPSFLPQLLSITKPFYRIVEVTG